MKKLKFSKLQNKIAEENNKRIQEIVAELVSGNNKKIFEDGLNGFYVDENPEGCWAEEIQKYIDRMSSEKQPVACLLGKRHWKFITNSSPYWDQCILVFRNSERL